MEFMLLWAKLSKWNNIITDFDKSCKGKQLDKGTKDDGTDIWEHSFLDIKARSFFEEVFEQKAQL